MFIMGLKIITVCLSTLMLFASCGGNTTNKKPVPPTVTTNGLQTAQQCGCTSYEAPVCGVYDSGQTQTFYNECVAKCFNTRLSHNMRCAQDQSATQDVCYMKETMKETEAFRTYNPIPSDAYTSSFHYGRCDQVQM